MQDSEFPMNQQSTALGSAQVGVFIDSVMCQDEDGRYYPLRDPFYEFIGATRRDVAGVTLASRCQRREVKLGETADFLSPGLQERFRPLPFYSGTEDYYRRFLALRRASLPLVQDVVARSDVIVIRIHHCLAVDIFRMARRHRKPIILFWSGPEIVASARINYPGLSPKALLAKAVARWEMRRFRALARQAEANLFLDWNEHRAMGNPPRTKWVCESRVQEASVQTTVRAREDRPIRFVFAGRLVVHKGLLELSTALERLRRNGIDFHLTVAGQGPDKALFLSDLERRGLTDSVEFVGALTNEEVQSLLRTSDAFVLPSYAEGMPKAIIESWAAGAAVIATDVGTVARYLKSGVNGILLRPGDVDGLEEALTQVATRENVRQGLVIQGFATAREHTFERELSTVTETLAEVLTAAR